MISERHHNIFLRFCSVDLMWKSSKQRKWHCFKCLFGDTVFLTQRSIGILFFRERDTLAHMTTPKEMLSNVVQALRYLDSHLPNGSHVILTGLVDGRFLWDNLHDRYHPLGKYEVLWGSSWLSARSCCLLSLKNLWIHWWFQANLTEWRRSEKYEPDTGCAAEVGMTALTIPSAGQVRPLFCLVPPPAIPTQFQTQAQHMLWWCKQAVLPQFWPKIVASLPALHPDCCYGWRWTFSWHSLMDVDTH